MCCSITMVMLWYVTHKSTSKCLCVLYACVHLPDLCVHVVVPSCVDPVYHIHHQKGKPQQHHNHAVVMAKGSQYLPGLLSDLPPAPRNFTCFCSGDQPGTVRPLRTAHPPSCHMSPLHHIPVYSARHLFHNSSLQTP